MKPKYRQKRALKPLDAASLRELALHYVSRFATSEAKLGQYLQRKLRERGWSGDGLPDIAALTADFAELGYVDDASFASARARSLTSRGYGPRRVGDELRAKGISEANAANARDEARLAAWSAADVLARRKRIGAYADREVSPEIKQKQLQMLLRAGHDYAIARAFVGALPGEPPEQPD